MKTTAKFVRELVDQHARRQKADTVIAKLREAEKIAVHFADQVEEIGRDPRFTPEGRADAARAVGQKALADLEKWFNPLRDGLTRHETQLLGDLRATLARPKPEGVAERIELSLLRSEIRAQARGLDPLGREILYRKADATVREALDEIPNIAVNNGVPTLTPFVSQDVREEVLFAEAEKKNPESAEMLASIRERRELYGIIRNVVEKSVTDVARELAPSEVVVG